MHENKARVPFVTLTIVSACVAMYVFVVFGTPNPEFYVLRFGLRNFAHDVAAADSAVRIFTYPFFHVSTLHFIVSLAFLTSFGWFAERCYGSRNMLILTVIAIVIGSIARIPSEYVTIGSSGIYSAYAGVMLITTIFIPRWRCFYRFVAIVLLGLLLARDLIGAFSAETGSAYDLHLACWVAGFAFAAYAIMQSR